MINTNKNLTKAQQEEWDNMIIHSRNTINSRFPQVKDKLEKYVLTAYWIVLISWIIASRVYEQNFVIGLIEMIGLAITLIIINKL